MTYLDFERLESLDVRAFRRAKPYPWVNPRGLLTESGHRELLETLPDLSMFERVFGKQRKFGQKSHDRFALEYRADLDLAPPWRAFLAELHGPRYRRALRRLTGVWSLDVDFHWHYTPRGESVSPHCDSKHKLGSHLFYLNSEKDWDPAWGGETLILGSKRRFDRRSAPEFSDFELQIRAQTLDNRSLIFARKGNSWHGVREITCPEGMLRKVFIVVINKVPVRKQLRRALRKRR